MMGGNVLWALAVVASLLPAVLADRCRPEYLPLIGTCVKVVATPITWNEARARCQAEDPPADLLTINPPERLEELTRLLNAHFKEQTASRYSYWVGGQGTNNNWRWVDNSKLSVKSNLWLPDHPTAGQSGFTRLIQASTLHKRRYLESRDERTIIEGFICEH
ncbi:uncharacterized protein LOC122261880 [Penaeus japonicus]|uniref:uncharacterized protein LOC122261880 n=1 Tax=Penaeus japonicus TaxID=27405 RepID=UPI001C70CAD9|nr:uncharacterized protein LOC122261880 [Penaeus japonicus]